jgi:hypothetical protein
LTLKTRIKQLEKEANIGADILTVYLTDFETIWDKLGRQEQLTIQRDIKRQENEQRAKGGTYIVIRKVPQGYKERKN